MTRGEDVWRVGSILQHLSKNTEESFLTLAMRSKPGDSIIIECMGRLTPYSLIKISFKSRGRQIEWIPQGPTLCSATWMWRVAPTSSSSSSSTSSSSSSSSSLCLSHRVIHFPFQACLMLFLPPSQYLQVPTVDLLLLFTPTSTRIYSPGVYTRC